MAHTPRVSNGKTVKATLTDGAPVTTILVMVARRRPFAIVYDPQVKVHLRVIEAKHHSLVRDTIAQQLLYDPDVETRNRKPLWSGAPGS
jgi:hypothetical protein